MNIKNLQVGDYIAVNNQMKKITWVTTWGAGVTPAPSKGSALTAAQVQPIPLSHELLLALGFVDISTSSLPGYQLYMIPSQKDDMPPVYLERDNNNAYYLFDYKHTIYYLHRLQAIFRLYYDIDIDIDKPFLSNEPAIKRKIK